MNKESERLMGSRCQVMESCKDLVKHLDLF